MGSLDSPANGLLIVDKPTGCTSHDVVQRVRRALKQKSVGHAGTLDPLATGVLVVAVGEGTKLVSHLQADDKRYDVTIAMGAETDSLDADGATTATANVPPLDIAMVERAAQPFIGRHPQEAPKLSAIKVGGRPLHRRMRQGEDVEAPVREVELHQVQVRAVSPTEDLSQPPLWQGVLCSVPGAGHCSGARNAWACEGAPADRERRLWNRKRALR